MRLSLAALAALLALCACGPSVTSTSDDVEEGDTTYPPAPPVVGAAMLGCWLAPGSPRPDGALCVTEDTPKAFGRCETWQGVDGTTLHYCSAL